MYLIERAIALGLAAKPDLNCVTGDFITFLDDFDSSRYVRALKRLAGATPSFAVLGNHDGGTWAESRGGHSDHAAVESLLRLSGLSLLHNRSELVRFRTGELRLAGVGDFWTQEIRAAEAFAEVSPEEPVILLSHNPDSKEVLGSHAWNLMLSGHTHGGQVIIPFDGPRYAPVIDKNYVAGLKPWRDRQIHVTRGVGNLGGVRFRCRPEVSLLHVE